MWQRQDGKPRLLGYASKTLPKSCANYSATELEMQGLLINMHLWKHLLHNVDFDACVDHLAIVQILKSKDMPANTRIVRLLDHLAKFKFSLYYIKGKDMILADFLSRIAVDEGDPSICEPISFNVIALRDEKFNSLVDTFCIATRNATRDKGISLPEVHGARKGVDPAFKPEHQHKSKKVLAKPVMQSQPQTKGISNTQVAGNKILKRSVKFLRRDQKTKGFHEPPGQQVFEPEIKTAHKPADESFSDPCDATPAAPARCHVPPPTIYRGPCHNNRPITSQPALIPADQTPVPAKLGTPVDEADQHLNSPYSDEDIAPSFRQPTYADFVMPPLLSDPLPDKTGNTSIFFMCNGIFYHLNVWSQGQIQRPKYYDKFIAPINLVS